MGTGPILLNEVACRGHESSLLECSYIMEDYHNCSHYEDASVECSGKNIFKMYTRLYSLCSI